MPAMGLAQTGASPGGVAVLYAVITLAVLVAFAIVLGLAMTGALKLTLGEHDRDLRWPRLWVRARRIVIRPYGELTTRQREAVFAVRAEVFLIEQGITQVPDQDGADPDCEHVLVYVGRRIVGTARLQTLAEQGVVKVGRVALLKPYRGRGVGTRLMQNVQAHLDRRGLGGVMNAQQYLEQWYSRLGWVRDGEPFTEAGLPHIRMVYRALTSA